jgi:hypothetical protein
VVVISYFAALVAVVLELVTDIESERLGSLWLVYPVAIYTWLVIMLVVLSRTIRIGRILRRGPELWGVHPDFIRALMADRVRTRESDPDRLGTYGDVRDDFEEEWYQDGASRPDTQPGAERSAAPLAGLEDSAGALIRSPKGLPDRSPEDDGNKAPAESSRPG